MNEDRFKDAKLPFDADSFTRLLVYELTDVLQEVVGGEEARGFVAVVGARIGDAFNAAYREAVGGRRLSREEVAAAMVDLKRRLGGGFHIVQQDDREIVLRNNCCPFGQQVKGRRCLCAMTSSVFGRIAAQNLGYAKVQVDEAIATGSKRCLVRVKLQPSAGDDGGQGVEYFRVGEMQAREREEVNS